MHRLFETNIVRSVQELNGSWEFAVLRDVSPLQVRQVSGIQQGNGESDDELLASFQYDYLLTVPGCWEMHPKLLTYRGAGAYRKRVTITRQTSLRLVFKGVSHTAHVYFDGQKIAEHYNAYTEFSTIVKDVEPGAHEVVVVVDNSFSEASALHTPNDYYTYGGIIRPVIIEEIGDLFIERLEFTPQKDDHNYTSDHWQGNIRAIVRNIGDQEQQFVLRGEVAGQELNLGSAKLAVGESCILGDLFSFSSIKAWNANSPQLYELNVKLYGVDQEKPLDDLIERVGFRTVTTNNGRIQVNGEDMVLKGLNRHEDHPLVGAAFPVALLSQDLDLLIDMGANAVRTSHYPNDERFLDLCDERGMMVWEENHARGLSLEVMSNPNFIWQCEQVNREMVEQHRNHPAIIIWAILNECASNTQEGRVHYKRQLEQLRSLDNSRPLTFASHQRAQELCFDLVDIVSFNLYPGWYGNEDPGELCELARGWADAAGGAGKPMIMSEFGGDGYYGFRSPTRVKGSEERQADIIESNLKAYLERDFISGMFIWQFCDCRVTEEDPWPMMRSMTQNSKGIVDAYRRPKLAYSVVQQYFNA
ncbi:glycoside hydrolase family 2 protein [Paenibacillus sp. FA6]|uniref:glycoside hydrolase family 2 protein n=1 Tax=Paenibacillus sp. FA6 TaxID=3413029 RepID=UPI003F65FEA6